MASGCAGSWSDQEALKIGTSFTFGGTFKSHWCLFIQYTLFPQYQSDQIRLKSVVLSQKPDPDCSQETFNDS